MYPVLDVARYVVSKSIADKQPITNMELQNLLYLIQREFLRVKGKAAFRESIEAWQFGPVVLEAYYYFSGAGAMPITICNMEKNPKIDEADMRMIDTQIEAARQKRPYEVSMNITRKGGAWDRTNRNGEGDKEIIPWDAIKEYG